MGIIAKLFFCRYRLCRIRFELKIAYAPQMTFAHFGIVVNDTVFEMDDVFN